MPVADEFTREFVVPFYLDVLHGSVAHRAPAERDEVLARMRAVAPDITFDIALHLWPRGWRESLMASASVQLLAP